MKIAHKLADYECTLEIDVNVKLPCLALFMMHALTLCQCKHVLNNNLDNFKEILDWLRFDGDSSLAECELGGQEWELCFQDSDLFSQI